MSVCTRGRGRAGGVQPVQGRHECVWGAGGPGVCNLRDGPGEMPVVGVPAEVHGCLRHR